ncbi:hypothetical protein [Anaerosporobacter faecicola]|nr:hypothetical protein [Anaerosporobacter faecicola]
MDVKNGRKPLGLDMAMAINIDRSEDVMFGFKRIKAIVYRRV